MIVGQVLLGFIIYVLLHNGGFWNGCITKRILLLQVFHSWENQYFEDYDKIYFYLFNFLFFYHREIVKLDHFMTLSLSYAYTILDAAVAKIHRFVAAPTINPIIVQSMIDKQ